MVTGTLENPIIGLQGEKSLDEGREILNCPVHDPRINDLIASLKSFVQAALLKPYKIEERTGELKGFILFSSEQTEEMYLRIILRSKESVDRIKKHIKLLTDQFPKLVCFSVNIQPIPHAVLEGEEEIILSTQSFVNHKLGVLNLRVGPQGFVQTNQDIAHKLYQTAALWVKELKASKFMELYSGQGAFSFFVSPYVKESLGIEINPIAVDEANRTSKQMGLTQLTFKCADATSVEKELHDFEADVVLVNPPRKGLGKGVELFQKHPSSYLIYSSCSYETLGLDLEALSSLYLIEKIQMFDMFPHTKHFETLVLLKRKLSAPVKAI